MMVDPTRSPTFPSDRWFEFLAAHASEEPEVYQALGFANFRLAVEIVPDSGGAATTYGIVFDGYDVTSNGELSDPAGFAPDATISGPLSAWTEMVDNIASHGGADNAHSLNALSIADTPLQVTAQDPLGKDRFFRYAETLQTLFDATARRVPVDA